MSIGSVSVDIVPDARGFPEHLRAEISRLRPIVQVGLDFDDAALAARLNAISARHLRIDVDVNLDTTAARAALARLASVSPTVNIDVRVDRGAVRDVDRLAAALARLNAQNTDQSIRIALYGDQTAIRDVTRLSAALNRMQRQDPIAIHIWVFIHGDREAIIRLGQLANAADRASGGSSGGRGGMGGLMKAALALSPALIPLGAAAAGMGAAFVAAGGVAALAFTGARREVELSTEAGKKFQRQSNLIVGDLHRLQTIAAAGVLQPYVQETQRLHQIMPLLNKEVATLAPLVGKTAGHVVNGLVGGLTNFAPLINEMVGGVERLSAKFESWATGPGGAKFAQALTEEYHRVGPVLGDVGNTLGKIGGALKPIGDIEIEGIGSVVRLVGNLADELHRFLDTKGVKDLLLAIGDAIKLIEPAAAGAIHSLGNLAESLGPVGSVLGFLVKGFALVGSASLHLGSAVGDAGSAIAHLYTDPTKIGGDLRHIGEDLGFVAKESETAAGLIASFGAAAQAVQAAKTAEDLKQLTDAADDLVPVLGVTRQQALVAADALKKHRDSVVAGRIELASFLRTNVDNVTAFENVSAATSRYTDALRAFAASGQTAADKAKLIGETLRAHQGDMLSYTGALAAGYAATGDFATAIKDEKRHIDDLREALKNPDLKGKDLIRAQEDAADAWHGSMIAAVNATTGLIDYRRRGALPLTQQLQAIQDAAVNAATATYQHELATKGAGKAAADARQIFDTLSHDSLVALGGQLGLDETAAGKFADKYFQFAGKDFDVTLRQIGLSDINNSVSALGRLLADIFHKDWDAYLSATDNASPAINNVHDALNNIPRYVGITIGLNNDVGQAVHDAVNSLQGHADGGLITGPGSGTSDSIVRRVSNGEFVMSAQAVQRFGVGTLDAMNNGAPASKFPAATAPAARPTANGVDLAHVGQAVERAVRNGLASARFELDGRAAARYIGNEAFGYERAG